MLRPIVPRVEDWDRRDGHGWPERTHQEGNREFRKVCRSAQPSLSTITSGIRIIHSIETNLKAWKHASGANYLRERHSGSPGVFPILWKMEIQRILGISDVCGYHLEVGLFLSFLRANRSYAKSSKMIDGRGFLTMENT